MSKGMQMVWIYAGVCTVVGFIPCSYLFLMIIECAMVYHLSVINRRPFQIVELGLIWGFLLAMSFIFQLVVGVIFDIGGPIGWFFKGLIALGFVLAFGGGVNWYYETENKKQGR